MDLWTFAFELSLKFLVFFQVSSSTSTSVVLDRVSLAADGSTLQCEVTVTPGYSTRSGSASLKVVRRPTSRVPDVRVVLPGSEIPSFNTRYSIIITVKRQNVHCPCHHNCQMRCPLLGYLNRQNPIADTHTCTRSFRDPSFGSILGSILCQYGYLTFSNASNSWSS